ncbi:DUF1761 domain-containing protein [Acidobacteriota bacterium]
MFSDLNWLAIITGTVFSMFLGFIWYGPLFANTWMKLVGLKKEDVNAKDSMKGMFISIIGSFIASACLAVIVKWMGHGLDKGLLAGALFSFAFVVTTIFSNDAYEKRPLSLTLINAGYRFVYFAVVGAILGIWV